MGYPAAGVTALYRNDRSVRAARLARVVSELGRDVAPAVRTAGAEALLTRARL